MAFCANCGSQVDGRFCAKCGAAIAADAATGGTIPPPPAAQAAGMADNMASALCYLLTILTGILFLVLEPYNRNRTIRFHAFQAIFFGVAAIALSIAGSILGIVLVALPVVGWILSLLIHMVIWLGFFVVWIMLMYKAYNNEKFVLPVIGPLAEKQANA